MRQTMSRKAQWIFVAIALCALLGIVDASFLASEQASKNSLLCFGSNSCETVLSSSYAHLFGVPISWLGIVFYVGLFVLAIVGIWRINKPLKTLLGVWVSGGVLFSLYLLFIQWVVLQSFCYYCLVSFFDVMFVGGLSVYFFKNFASSVLYED